MDIESIDKKCEDTDIRTIKNEIELFFEDKHKSRCGEEHTAKEKYRLT